VDHLGNAEIELMDKWRYFVWLSRQTVHGMLWAWPVSAVLIGAAVVSIGIAVRRGRGWPSFGPAWQLAFTLNPAAILAIGTIWACENCSPSSLGQGVRHFWAMRAVDVLSFTQLFAAAWWVWRAATWRLCVATVHALLLWATFWASFLAGMSLSGDWL
jgi:hypothetical protein